MREIKFRVWNLKHKEFRYWGFIERGFIGIPTGGGLEIEECKVNSQQFTGIKDKNGKEIYEGDIIIDKCIDEIVIAKPMKWFMVDAFNVYGYSWTDRFIDNYDDPTDNKFIKNAEVIGNIYENPELLESI